MAQLTSVAYLGNKHWQKQNYFAFVYLFSYGAKYMTENVWYLPLVIQAKRTQYLAMTQKSWKTSPLSEFHCAQYLFCFDSSSIISLLFDGINDIQTDCCIVDTTTQKRS